MIKQILGIINEIIDDGHIIIKDMNDIEYYVAHLAKFDVRHIGNYIIFYPIERKNILSIEKSDNGIYRFLYSELIIPKNDNIFTFFKNIINNEYLEFTFNLHSIKYLEINSYYNIEYHDNYKCMQISHINDKNKNLTKLLILNKIRNKTYTCRRIDNNEIIVIILASHIIDSITIGGKFSCRIIKKYILSDYIITISDSNLLITKNNNEFLSSKIKSISKLNNDNNLIFFSNIDFVGLIKKTYLYVDYFNKDCKFIYYPLNIILKSNSKNEQYILSSIYDNIFIFFNKTNNKYISCFRDNEEYDYKKIFNFQTIPLYLLISYRKMFFEGYEKYIFDSIINVNNFTILLFKSLENNTSIAVYQENNEIPKSKIGEVFYLETRKILFIKYFI